MSRSTRSLGAVMYDYATGLTPQPTPKHFAQLLEMGMLDKNYSSAKEEISCYIVGANRNTEKHDYDGTILIKGVHRPVEVKPTTYWGRKGGELRMKCAFADYTEERLKRDIAEDVYMVVTGFDGTRLLYGVAFDFNAPPFLKAIRQQMDSVMATGTVGQRITPAPNISAIAQIENVEILYPSKAEAGILDKHKHAMTGATYKFLKARLGV